MEEANEKVVLPPKYYLQYFNYLLDFVQDKYKHILAEAEWRFLRKYYCLSEDAQCLFIRFTNRRGLFFKTEKLAYAELTDIAACLQELGMRGFIEKPSTAHDTFGKELLQTLAKDELLGMLDELIGQNSPTELDKKAIKKLKKDELSQVFLENFSFESLIENINQKCNITKVCFEYETTFMRFLFFGNRYMDMTEFVVRDLGLIQFESHNDDQLIARFNTRKDAEDKWLVTDQNDLFNQLKDTAQPLEVFDWFMTVHESILDLSEVAMPAYERLIIKVATFLEKSKAFDEALRVFKLTPKVPSRERQARILVKMKLEEEARSFCQIMLENPQNADEKFFATDLVLKLNSKKKISKKSTTSWLHQSDSITVPAVFKGQVEMGTINHYHAEGWNAVFSENHLWRAIFGLVFWDIVFDPALVSFHHPFQRRPSDLFLPDFYQKRKDIILQHLAKFENIQELLQHMGERFENKAGIANPFVVWLDDIWLMARKAVELINFEALKIILHEMAKNMVENLRGFPDLFVWNETEFCFVEVKSPTDNLSNQQLYWLQFFQEIGVPSKVLRVDFELKQPDI